MSKEQKMSPGELFLLQLRAQESRGRIEKAFQLYADSFQEYESRLKTKHVQTVARLYAKRELTK